MSHLTKDTAIRACDTFDCHVGTVWIPVFVHGHIALIVYILGRYLAICDQAVEPCFVCYETSFTVGSRIAVYTTQFCFCQPWGLICHNLGVNHLGNMASNGIHSQCRGIELLCHDLTFRNQSQLDQRLEAVADTKHQTISLI